MSGRGKNGWCKFKQALLQKKITAAFLKHLRGGQEHQPPRLMVSINRVGHFLLTEVVKKPPRKTD